MAGRAETVDDTAELIGVAPTTTAAKYFRPMIASCALARAEAKLDALRRHRAEGRRDRFGRLLDASAQENATRNEHASAKLKARTMWI
jgi:hypothetical protein